MNVFATLKTVFFGSKFLSSPVPIDGTPRRDLVSALNGLMPLCRTIPGVRLALDIREGQVVLAVTRNFAASLFRNIKYFTLRKLYLCRKWMQKRLQKTTTTGITLPNFDFLA